MSGICGLFRFDGTSIVERDLERMAHTIAHRGPDRIAHWRDGAVGLASLQMRVTQEDRLDAQPVRLGGVTLVADARIDNREAVADALGIGPRHLAQLADSALIAEAYAAWGPDSAARLIGDFVFAAWDARTRRLTLARDAMGQRALFLHLGANVMAFASETGALYALPEVPRVLSDEVIARALLFSPDDRPVLERGYTVAALPGGSVMTVESGGRRDLRRYWTPHAGVEHQGRDLAYYVAAYRRVLAEAVACRVRRNIHASGVFLSGGFDSSSVCCLAAQGARRLVAASAVRGQGPPEPRADNRPWIEILRRWLPGLEHHYVADGLDPLAAVPRAFVEADVAGGVFYSGTHRLCVALSGAGARAVMDGVGGDYTLNPTGSGYFAAMLRAGALRPTLAFLHARIRSRGLLRVLLGDVIAPFLPNLLHRYRAWRRGAPLSGMPALIAAEFGVAMRRQGISAARPRRMAGRAAGLLRYLRQQQEQMQMPPAIQAAHHGLVFTRPFHDPRVVELALAIPEELHRVAGVERAIGRCALADVLPPEFQRREKGTESLVPDLSDQLARLRPALLDEIDRMAQSERLTRYFDFDGMKRLLLAPPRRLGDPVNLAAANEAFRAFQLARYVEWAGGANR